MSTDYHLKQEQLVGAKSNNALQKFGIWLQKKTTSFEENKEQHFEYCTDDNLTAESEALLKDLGIMEKIKFQRFGFVALRVPGPSPANFQITEGHAIMIPIRVLDGIPSVSGKEVVPGYTTYIEEPIKVTPALECLFIIEARRNKMLDGPL